MFEPAWSPPVDLVRPCGQQRGVDQAHEAGTRQHAGLKRQRYPKQPQLVCRAPLAEAHQEDVAATDDQKDGHQECGVGATPPCRMRPRRRGISARPCTATARSGIQPSARSHRKRPGRRTLRVPITSRPAWAYPPDPFRSPAMWFRFRFGPGMRDLMTSRTLRQSLGSGGIEIAGSIRLPRPVLISTDRCGGSRDGRCSSRSGGSPYGLCATG